MKGKNKAGVKENRTNDGEKEALVSLARDLASHLEWAGEMDVVGYAEEVVSSVTSGEQTRTLAELETYLDGCDRCPLSQKRNTVVFGTGNSEADLCIVGEGPGVEEDRQGKPFVGAAGQLLDRILAAMGVDREKVYICNVVKCRPPGNRTPRPDEMATCGAFLEEQIEAVQPEVILALGATASRYLLDTSSPISALRGKFHDYNGKMLRVTYHPAYLLRNPAEKRKTWNDVQAVMKVLGLKKPGSQ